MAPRVSARIVRVTTNIGDRVRPGQPLAQLDSIELGEAHSTHRQAQSPVFRWQGPILTAPRSLRPRTSFRTRIFLRAHNNSKAGPLSAPRKTGAAVGCGSARFGGGAAMQFPAQGAVRRHRDREGCGTRRGFGPADQSIFTIADLSTLWIEANLFEKTSAECASGAGADVTVSAYPGEVIRTRLTYISSTVDKVSRAVQARVEVPNPDGRLKPEIFATASIDTASSTKFSPCPRRRLQRCQRSGDGIRAGRRRIQTTCSRTG